MHEIGLRDAGRQRHRPRYVGFLEKTVVLVVMGAGPLVSKVDVGDLGNAREVSRCPIGARNVLCRRAEDIDGPLCAALVESREEGFPVPQPPCGAAAARCGRLLIVVVLGIAVDIVGFAIVVVVETALRSPDVGTMSERVAHRRGVGEVSEQNGVGPTRLRHSIGVGEVLRYRARSTYRSRRGAPIPFRHSVGVGEVLRYHSDTWSERGSERNINKFTFY